MAWAPPQKVGDTASLISDAKKALGKFSYGKNLGDSPLYTEAFGVALKIFQSNVHILVSSGRRDGPDVNTSGIFDWATKVQLGLIEQAESSAAPPVMITAQGTGVDMWTGPPADTARALEQRGLVQFQPLGDWPATPFPMWPSITQGVSSGEVQVRKWAGDQDRNIVLAGYSQGANVVSLLWKYSLAPGGPLEDLRHKVVGAVTWGNPMREAGKGAGDGADWDFRPETSGIMQDRLVDTPSWWRDYAHKDDLYTDCELDDEGEWKRAICKIVMGNDWWSGKDNIFEQVVELFSRPVEECWAMAMAIWDAGLFFGRGTRPHVDYVTQPAVDFLASIL